MLGYEQNALKSQGEHLHKVKYIMTECSIQSTYTDGATFSDVATYLADYHFEAYTSLSRRQASSLRSRNDFKVGSDLVASDPKSTYVCSNRFGYHTPDPHVTGYSEFDA